MKQFSSALALLLYMTFIILPMNSSRSGNIRSAATILHYSVQTRRSKLKARRSKPKALPLTLSKIKDLVMSTPDNAIATDIGELGIDFQPDASILDNLRSMGAGVKTIAALQAYLDKPTGTRAISNPVRETVDKWLTSKEYVLYEPLGMDLPPASVFLVKGSSADLVMSSQEVLPNASNILQASTIPESIQLPQVELSRTSSLPFLPNVDIAALRNLGARFAIVQLSGIRTNTIPLSKLEDAIKAHPKLKDKAKAKSPDLLIVYAVLQATEIRLTLLDESGELLNSDVNLQSLKAALGTEFEVALRGTNVLHATVNLGIKAKRLDVVSTVLGGGREELRLKDMPAKSLRPLFRNRATPISFNSGYQVFGLVIAQGNYIGKSERVGGALPDAVASAELMKGNLRRLVRPGLESNIRTVTSRKGSLFDFDKSKPLSQTALNARIDKFIRYVQARVDRKKPSVIFFYYFGHGLARPQTFYLVPENFVDQPEKSIVYFEDKLIDLDEVYNKLNKLPGIVVLLIDSCRELKETDDLERVRNARGHLVFKQFITTETATTLEVGIIPYGSYPVLFAGDEGDTVPVVRHSINGYEKEIGPLSLRLHLLFNTAAERQETLTLGDFIKRMQEPIDITLADGNRLQSYTPLIEEFLNELPSTPLLSASPKKK